MRHRRLIVLAVVVALAAFGWGGYAWWQSTKRITTDDAYVEGSIVVISAKVSGHVAELHLEDNRAVKAGDLLLRIDPRDYQARRDQARASVAVAQASHQATSSETQLTRETTSAHGRGGARHAGVGPGRGAGRRVRGGGGARHRGGQARRGGRDDRGRGRRPEHPAPERAREGADADPAQGRLRVPARLRPGGDERGDLRRPPSSRPSGASTRPRRKCSRRRPRSRAGCSR